MEKVTFLKQRFKQMKLACEVSLIQKRRQYRSLTDQPYSIPYPDPTAPAPQTHSLPLPSLVQLESI